MFEHSSLHELYTGSLIAGKGKQLNNIRTIMERTKFRTEDWARVRFGAGTPWRRCWCVIEPPDEKEWQRSNKSLKKKSAYDRPSLPKGDIKFYDTKKTKKATPIATITDAYSAYAIYPQSKPLIDQSTLVKVEGRITIHSKPESKTEGFVFVMPELHPAVSGFEMMLRWLFPVYDIFHLYGRPQRLIADTWDSRGLMFAMPKERRYGYLDIIDVAALIHTQGSDKWNEREWRKQLKEMTSKRMAMTTQSRSSSNLEGRRPGRTTSESRYGIHYEDDASVHSTPSSRHQHNQSTDAVFTASPMKATTTPANAHFLTPGQNQHTRSVSESVAYMSPTKTHRQKENYMPSRLSAEYADMEPIPPPPAPTGYHGNTYTINALTNELETADSRDSSDSDGQGPRTNPEDIHDDVRESTPPAPVMAPPTFQHQATDIPRKRPDARPDLRREKSRMSNATLSQMVDVNKLANSGAAGHAAMVAWNNGRPGEDQGLRGVNETLQDEEIPANQLACQAMVADGADTKALADVRPEYARLPSQDSINRKAITRKPVPTQVLSVLEPPDRAPSPESMSQYSASNYDYSSTDSGSLVEHFDGQTLPRRRPGVLRTVGDPKLGNAIDALRQPLQFDIPAIDFGTTIIPSLTPGQSRPQTALQFDIPTVDFGTTITPSLTPGPSRPQTAGGLLEGQSPFDERRLAGSQTPNEENRASYISRTGSRLHRSQSSSCAWQPGAAAGSQSPFGGLTAEEFVQQRAAAARMPNGYVPHRSMSSSKIEQSPKKLQKKRDSSGRPSSRNSLLLDYSSYLSAREQEHVARVTGGPLINVGERSKTPDPSIGLIGAIEAREQEKKNVKEGLAGHMVQEAIAQRQAADRNYSAQQSPGYNLVIDARQNGQWINARSSMNWGAGPLTTSHPPPAWLNQQAYQYQQVQQQQMQQMYPTRYSGYYGPLGTVGQDR